jgi:hypothetical protein
MFFSTQVFSAQTYVILDDVVFTRSDPKLALSLEKMNLSELQNEYLKMNENFPPHFFYGQNVRGDMEPGITDAVRVYGMFEGKAVTGFIDKKKLWQEPTLSQPEAPSALLLKDLNVLLLPDASSRKVLSLYHGEVVQVIGKFNYQNSSWIKAKFDNRFGYIEEKYTQPMIAAKIDESSLTVNEIPPTGRNFDHTLGGPERTGLSKTGFFIEPVFPRHELSVDDMADLYQEIPSAVFLTSDLYLHSFHLIFDRMLQNIEYEKLYPEIVSLTTRLTAEAARELKAYRGKQEKVRKALTYNLFYFSVAAKLLDPNCSVQQEVRPDVGSVVKQILDATGSMPQLKADIKPGEEDFSMYRVRGHYEPRPIKDEYSNDVTPDDPERLSRYFRAMMWYGRRPFLFGDDINTLSAIFIVKTLEQTGEIKRWERIDEVLRKLIGNTDDWSPRDYQKVILQTYGKVSPAPDSFFNDEAALKKFKDIASKSLVGPRIIDRPTGNISQASRVEANKGFRFLGMRFTWDAHLFNQLTYPNVPERNLPTALDAMAIFGSSAAEEIMKLSLEKQNWKNAYYNQQQKLKKTASGEIDKKETTYDSWLHTFSALFLPVESKQFFARTDEWQYKNLNAALGSWTELKHDTILYSKQSGAECGEGTEFEIPPYNPPSIKGYVEPNPLFFKRLSELVGSLGSDLARTGFLTDEYKDKFQKFDFMTKQAFAIAKKEIERAPITEQDYAWIHLASHEFNRGLLLPRHIGDIIDPDILKMALVADVATDYFSGNVLEVSVGAPQKITVAVKDLFGGTRLTTGYVYSWYEFTDTKRWTDSEWKQIVYDNDQTRIHSMRPSWYFKFQKPQ